MVGRARWWSLALLSRLSKTIAFLNWQSLENSRAALEMTNRKWTLALIFILRRTWRLDRLIVALQLVIETEHQSEAVDEFATSYPLAIGWMVGNSESRISTGNEHMYINERIGKSTYSNTQGLHLALVRHNELCSLMSHQLRALGSRRCFDPDG